MLKPKVEFPIKHRTTKGADRIQNLITVAADLFLEYGFDGVSVDLLISGVGGSRRNVYGHFEGKDGLFKAAMAYLCEEISGPLEKLNIGEREDVLPSFARQLLNSVLDPRTPALHRLLVIESKRFTETAQMIWATGCYKIVKNLASWIEVRQQQPNQRFVSEVPAQMLAEQFINMVTSDIKLRVIVGVTSLPLCETEIDTIANNAVNTFLRGVALSQTPSVSTKTKTSTSSSSNKRGSSAK